MPVLMPNCLHMSITIIKIMSEINKVEQSKPQKCSTAVKVHVENNTEPRRKTTSKFSTMVPQARSTEVEVTQDESQMFDLSNDDDFRSSTSSVNSTESGSSIFLSASGCQAVEIVEANNRNQTSQT